MKLEEILAIWEKLNLLFGNHGKPTPSFYNAVQILRGWEPLQSAYWVDPKKYQVNGHGICIKWENERVFLLTYPALKEFRYRIERDLGISFSEKILHDAIEFCIETGKTAQAVNDESEGPI